MKDRSKYYLTDHYSWVKTETGTFTCAHETADGLVYSVLSQDKHTLLEGNASYMEFKKNDKLVDSPSAAYIYRIQCPNLWNCIGTNIIRQVIRASQAKNMYRTFSEYVGERVILTGGIHYHLFPSPQKVLETPDSTYQRMGMSFKRDALKNAARFILEHADRLEKIQALDLLDELRKYIESEAGLHSQLLQIIQTNLQHIPMVMRQYAYTQGKPCLATNGPRKR